MAKKPTDPAALSAHFICSRPLRPATLSSPAMAATPTPAASPCPRRMWFSSGPNWLLSQKTATPTPIRPTPLGCSIAPPLQEAPLLAGDPSDLAFPIGHNDRPDFGGLELTLRDFKI